MGEPRVRLGGYHHNPGVVWGGEECPVPTWEGAAGHTGWTVPRPNHGGLPQVNAGNVLYEHKMPAEPFWEAHDTLKLRLASPPAPDVATTLAVTVSFEAACPQRPSRLWRNKGKQHDRLAKLEGHWERPREEWTQGQGQPPGPGIL